MSQTIAIIGATGMLGQPVARRLRQDGHHVRICSRSADKARKMYDAEFDVLTVDVEAPETIRAALEGADGVHINLNGGPTDADYDRIEHLGTANVARVAAELGLQRLTVTSGISARPENAGFPPTAAKLHAMEAIKQSGVPFTIFRPHWFYESLPLFVKNGRAILFGSMPHRWHWLAVADYADMVARSYVTAEAAGQVFDVWGPEAISMAEALSRYSDARLGGASLHRLPLWRTRLFATLRGNERLKSTVNKMRFWNQFAESGDPHSSNALLGAPHTTLQEWLSLEQAGTHEG